MSAIKAKKAPKSRRVVASVDFLFERATKNKYRYAEQTEPGSVSVIGTLYVDQSTFKEGSAAHKLTVDISILQE